MRCNVVPTPEAVAAQASAQDQGRAWLREGTCSALAIAGFVLFLVSVGLALTIGKDNDASKFYLMVADKLMVLVGAIFGYYFGRNPAERAADAARSAESAARTDAATAKRTSRELAGAVIAYATSPSGGGLADPQLRGMHDAAVRAMNM